MVRYAWQHRHGFTQPTWLIEDNLPETGVGDVYSFRLIRRLVFLQLLRLQGHASNLVTFHDSCLPLWKQSPCRPIGIPCFVLYCIYIASRIYLLNTVPSFPSKISVRDALSLIVRFPKSTLLQTTPHRSTVTSLMSLIPL